MKLLSKPNKASPSSTAYVEPQAPAPKKFGKKKMERKVAVSQANFDMNDFMSRMNTKYGEGTIFRASSAVGLVVRHLSTGAFRLDVGLGGGLPLGRMIEIFGNESAGKSTLLYSTFAQFQKQFSEGGICVLLDLERTFVAEYAANLGVDLDRLFVISPDFGEQACDQLDEVMMQKTDILVGVDSIAAMTPISTMEVSAEKAEVGVHARLINRAVAKCNARMKRNLVVPDYPTTTVIWINQEREKVGVMFGDPSTTPGGKGKNFFTSVRIKLFSSGSAANKIMVPQTFNGVKKDILVGRVVNFTIVKNKIGGTPFEDGTYNYYIKPHKGYPAWTFDNADAIFEAGRFHGIIETLPQKQGVLFKYGDFSTKMPHLFVKEIIDNEALADELRVKVLAAVKTFNSAVGVPDPEEIID